MLDFSYNSYKIILESLIDAGYKSCLIGEHKKNKVLYLRHDVDFDFIGSIELAKIEKSLGLKSTWYFLVNCPTYNLLSEEVILVINELVSLGHQVGLHIDATLYSDEDEMIEKITSLYDFYSKYIPLEKTLSFHRPASWLLKNNLKINGWINAYENEYFKECIYISDSNRREFWRENRLDLALSNDSSEDLCLLTHPIWWNVTDVGSKMADQSVINTGIKTIKRYLAKTCKIYVNKV